jgi:hypothetical protein
MSNKKNKKFLNTQLNFENDYKYEKKNTKSMGFHLERNNN